MISREKYIELYLLLIKEQWDNEGWKASFNTKILTANEKYDELMLNTKGKTDVNYGYTIEVLRSHYCSKKKYLEEKITSITAQKDWIRELQSIWDVLKLICDLSNTTTGVGERP